MSVKVTIETDLVETTLDMPDIGLAGADKRRPGRSTRVNKSLIPMLRGHALTAAEVPHVQAKTCAVHGDSAPIFPLSMAFQPIVDVQQNRIDSYEALVRGPQGQGAHYVLGQVTAENTYAFDQACRIKAIELAARLGLDKQLSINFLPNAVYDPRACIQATLRAAARMGFPRDRLTFEILESETISDTTHLLSIIKEYRKQGFKIALDDFGRGYSGLSRLAELRPDIVKVDRVLIRDCDKDRTRLAVIAGIIAIGEAIDVQVVVEGVETAKEVDALKSIGVRFIQGSYFAKPTFKRVVKDYDITWKGSLGYDVGGQAEVSVGAT